MLAYAQIAAFSCALYAFVPIVALLRHEQGTTYAQAAFHLTALAGGTMVGKALHRLVSHRLTRSVVIWAGLVTVAAAVLGLATLPPVYPLTLTLAGVLGLGGFVAMTGVALSLASFHEPLFGPEQITEATAASLAGALLGPFVVGSMVGLGVAWQPGLASSLVALALVAVIGWRLRHRVRSTPEPAPVPKAPATRPMPIAVSLAWLMLIQSTTVEVMLLLWVPEALMSAGLGPGQAVAAVAAILAGMLVGRIATPPLLEPHTKTTVYLGSVGVSLVGVVLAWVFIASTPVSIVPVLLSLALCGLGMGPQYPVATSLVLAVAPTKRKRAARSLAYTYLYSLGLSPVVFGAAAPAIDPAQALGVPLVSALAFAAALAVVRRTVAKPLPPDRQLIDRLSEPFGLPVGQMSTDSLADCEPGCTCPAYLHIDPSRIPPDWETEDGPVQGLGDFGRIRVPGLGMRRWTIFRLEEHATALHERHTPGAVGPWPLYRALCRGCTTPTPYQDCPYAAWVRNTRDLTSHLFIEAVMTAHHPNRRSDGSGTPGDRANVTHEPAARPRPHIQTTVEVKGAASPARLVVNCDGSVGLHTSGTHTTTPFGILAYAQDLLHRHRPIGPAFTLNREFPYVGRNDKRICHACAHDDQMSFRYRVCQAREWAAGWLQAPGWVRTCVGVPCTQWDSDPRTTADTGLCTSSAVARPS